MNVICFWIMSYAFASIVIEQRIFEEPRATLKSWCESDPSNIFRHKLGCLLCCMFCTGFWAGFAVTLLGYNVINTSWLDPFFGGLLSAPVVYWIHLVQCYTGKKLNSLGIDT